MAGKFETKNTYNTAGASLLILPQRRARYQIPLLLFKV